jgi:glycerol-3-phosphate acyltransferase PlsX
MMPFRIAVDAMGGDHAPEMIVRGAVDALCDFDDIELILVGDEARIRESIPELNGSGDRLRVVHASESIGMEESPVESIRRKKDSSLLRVIQLGAEGAADAVLSAGNTGAYAAACQLKLRPLPCISRPGIAVTIPTFHKPIVLCDVGANIYAKPHHLYEYAVMASLYAECLLALESPRVALLSIGEESLKGTELVRQAHALLKADERIRFVGNVEGRDLFNNRCDVAVCDGFVGNIVLKLAEGLSEGLIQMLERELAPIDAGVVGELSVVLDRVRCRHDYSEYGGAPLLGIDGTCIICHGRSNAPAIRNGVLTARRFRRLGFNEAIVRRFAS